MAKPRVFIGSSLENLAVAHLLAKGLKKKGNAVRVWDEDVFSLNRNFLEVLNEEAPHYDYAVFVLAPDDMTTSKGEQTLSVRDNVLFEGGLFMGVLGRQQVFFVYDRSVKIKKPSDFNGVTLAEYDGSLINQHPEQAVGQACTKIACEIKRPRFEHLMGRWKSIYRLTTEDGCPDCEEELEISPSRDGVSITCITTTYEEEDYTAFGRLPQPGQIVGEWNSVRKHMDTGGTFVLNVGPKSNFMYGYFTSPDEKRGVVYAGWALAKIANANQDEIQARLTKARSMLAETTFGFAVKRGSAKRKRAR